MTSDGPRPFLVAIATARWRPKMASLLPDKLFEARGQAPAPSKDFYQVLVTRSQVRGRAGASRREERLGPHVGAPRSGWPLGKLPILSVCIFRWTWAHPVNWSPLCGAKE